LEYGYKPTTNGRALITKCMALEKPLILTRVAFGSGLVAEDVNLADVHELVSYVVDGAIGERIHKDDRLHLTVQYDNSAHPDTPTFYLNEFIVYGQDPETSEDVDLLYLALVRGQLLLHLDGEVHVFRVLVSVPEFHRWLKK